jgi:hypothetical protein
MHLANLERLKEEEADLGAWYGSVTTLSASLSSPGKVSL